jgi:hypothetical protein
VKICLLSNNYCLISYNIKRFFVGGFLVTFLVPLKFSTIRFSIRFEYVVTRFVVGIIKVLVAHLFQMFCFVVMVASDD